MKELFQTILKNLDSGSESIKTVSVSSYGKSFIVSRFENYILVQIPDDEPTFTTFKTERKISESEFKKVETYFDRWWSGDKYVRSQLSKISHNTSYILSIIHKYKSIQPINYNFHPFWEWYEAERQVTKGSIQTYKNSFRNLYRKLDLKDQNILQITDVDRLSSLIAGEKFQLLDKKNGRSFSSPINAYIEYLTIQSNNKLDYRINNRNIINENSYYLSKKTSEVSPSSKNDFLVDAVYQSEIENLDWNVDSVISHQDVKEPKQVSAKESLLITAERSAKNAQKAFLISNFKCDFDNEHESFISDRTKRNYLEAHHLIPLSNRGLFNYSIDVCSNIVPLCPNCHRIVHHGISRDRLAILKKIFIERVDRLKASGIDISFSELKSFYNII